MSDKRCNCIGIKQRVGHIGACGCNCRGCKNGQQCVNDAVSGKKDCRACQ